MSDVNQIIDMGFIDANQNAGLDLQDQLTIQSDGEPEVVPVEQYVAGETQFDAELSPMGRLAKIQQFHPEVPVAPSLFRYAERLHQGRERCLQELGRLLDLMLLEERERYSREMQMRSIQNLLRIMQEQMEEQPQPEVLDPRIQ